VTDVEAMLTEAVRRRGLGGVGVAIVRKGRRPEFTTVGLADPVAGRPISPDTVFRIASITKTMTAIGVLQLRDEGLFDLDDPVNNYLKRLTVAPPRGGPEVTFRHLLTHTAGIGEMPSASDLPRRPVWGLGPPGTAAADLPALYRGTLRAEVRAGSKWAYANHGFALLGQLVEDISGQPLAEYMQEKVFGPLKMSSTEYRRTDRTAGQVATGTHWILGRFRTVRDYDLTIFGAGAVLSSLNDMAAYAAWLSKGPTSRAAGVLKAATLNEMMTLQHTIDPRLPGLGLAFFLNQFGEHRVAGHDGNIPGFASALLVAPDDGVGVVVLTNTASLFGANLLAARLLRSLLGVPEPASALPQADLASSPHLWSELESAYAPAPGFLTNLRSWQMLGGEVQVVIKQRHLTLQALSPFRQVRRGLELHPTDADDPLRFAFEMDGLVVAVAFERSGSGDVDRLVIGRPVNGTFHRRPPWRSSRRRLRAAAGIAALALHRTHRRRRRAAS
jgi:CubicO group peptidase (beta-lactamase class C family)